MPSPDPFVHVIDDDEAIRDSLAFLFGTAGFEVATYPSAEAFLAESQGSGVACILSDVRMPGMSGIELLRALKARGSRLPVIMMTGHGDIALAVEAMKAGATDFIEKPFDDKTLLRTVRAAVGEASAHAARDAERGVVAARIAALSPRERDVLAGLVAGKANKAIAFDLGISPRTVEVYRANLMTKMQAGSLSELVRMALTSGIGAAPGN